MRESGVVSEHYGCSAPCSVVVPKRYDYSVRRTGVVSQCYGYSAERSAVAL